MKLAIVKTGGKQYIVKEGDFLRVEKLAAEAGARWNLPEVLLYAEDEKLEIGMPRVAGKSVEAEVVVQGRAKKIIVLKYKAKSRYQKKRGHRQPYTKIKITTIK